MILSDQFFDARDCLVELVSLDAESNAVVPQSPIPFVHLECLLCARESFLHFILDCITVGDVTPSLALSFINRDDDTESKDGFLVLFKSHVGTTARKPGVFVQPVYSKGFVEAFN